MQVSYTVKPGATYVRLTDAKIVRTVCVSDLVMVDVDAHDEPVGVEFAVSPRRITPVMLDRLADRFPRLKDMRETDDWLLSPA